MIHTECPACRGPCGVDDYNEVAPAIRKDCKSEDIGIWATGPSIGAFHAVAVTCRFPDIFHRALGLSGSYNLMRWIERPDPVPMPPTPSAIANAGRPNFSFSRGRFRP